MTARPRTAAIVLARAASSRLKDKMLLPFGRSTVVETAIERLRACAAMDDFVLATSDTPQDDVFEAVARRAGLPLVRGSERDVVARMIKALDSLSPAPELVVRACSDNPMLMPAIVDDAIALLERTGADVVTPFEFNTLPFGYGMVAMTAACLRRIDRESREAVHREHVENFCFDHPERFRVAYQIAPAGCSMPQLGLSLDYADDYRRLRRAWELVADLPPARQHDALLERLRAARTAIVGAGAPAARLADGMARWLSHPPRVMAEWPTGFDLVIGLAPPAITPPEATRGVFWIEGARIVDGQGRTILALSPWGENGIDRLLRTLPEAMPVLLGGHPRPESLRPSGLPADDKIGVGERRGFASRRQALFPTEIYMAPGISSALRAAIVAEAAAWDAATAPRDGTPPPLPAEIAVFRRLFVDVEGRLGHDGPNGRDFAPIGGPGDSIAGAWRGAAMTQARAEVLNRRLKAAA